jgi:hypothetical protein
MTKAIQVVARDNFTILVTLEDGKIIEMNMAFLKTLSGPVVDPLKNLSEFKKVFVRNGIVTWPTGFDIDPYFLVESGTVTDKTA